MADTITVTLRKSVSGRLKSHQDTVRGLGLRRLHHTVEVPNTPEVRGMIKKIEYLLEVGSN